MSEVLRVAPARMTDELPFAIDLELRVEDRDVIAALVNYPDGPPREEYALEALKIGVLALRRASSALDGEFIQRETTRLLESLQEKLERHADAAKSRFESSLKEYFHPESGQFSQRVGELTSENGGLARLLKDLLDGDNSRLAKTMVSHVGESSALMKYLRPQQADGLLAILKANVEKQLLEQQLRFQNEFSLNNPDGALCQLIAQLTQGHGNLSKDLKEKIDEVIKEFSLDKKDSALSRLVKNVDEAQQKITSEFSLDNEQSALRRLKLELTTILEAHVKTNADFQEEVKIALAQLVTRRETEARGTQHGGTFESAVFEFINRDAQRRGDVAEDTGNTPGLIKNRKFGDVVLHMGRDSIAAGAKVVVEAKEVAGYTIKAAQDEIEQARKNRDAQHGVFVFSQRTAPCIDGPLARYGDDVFVIWDAEDGQTDANLIAALEIARALCVRRRAVVEREHVDFTPIDRAINTIEKQAQNLDKIRSSAETILDRVRIDRKAIDDQIAVLREAMTRVKHALGENDAATDGASVAESE